MGPINIRSVGAREVGEIFQLWERAGSKTMAQKSHELGETRNDAEGN